ncbi:MAG TPA: T9SS type A sorting domain-containing protein [Saprospiraceae bacterium]
MAQEKYDNNWIMGYPPNLPSENFGGFKFNFNEEQLRIEYFSTKCHANEAAVLSSPSGKLLAYSEGCRLYNGNHEIMSNGDSLAFGQIWESYCDIIGYPGTQHHLLLPWPDDSTKAVLFYLKIHDNNITSALQYAIISFDNSNTLGYVTSKDQTLIETETTALLTATKHANGRDWWILLPERNSNRFFISLLEPNGVTVVDTQAIGDHVNPSQQASQAVFTPNGQKFIRFEPTNGLDIFDFDRCSGQLFNPLESGPLSDPILNAGGVACSIDSKYLYVSNRNFLYQFDLGSDDILLSSELIGTYDGYLDPFPTSLYHMLLAPDGKIYMFSSNGVQSGHVIDHPERKGTLCDFKQHVVSFPAHNKIGSPAMPYFRLGPLDNSICDTLGIDNVPVAYFKYTPDSVSYLRLNITNLSYFEPESFNWDFGDGQMSSVESPKFVLYEVEGEYEICLDVANQYGSSTYCQIVNVSDSITDVLPPVKDEFEILPNPFYTTITLRCIGDASGAEIEIFTVEGQQVRKEKIVSNYHAIDLVDLNQGIFIYTIMKDLKIIQKGKLIKVN